MHDMLPRARVSVLAYMTRSERVFFTLNFEIRFHIARTTANQLARISTHHGNTEHSDWAPVTASFQQLQADSSISWSFERFMQGHASVHIASLRPIRTCKDTQRAKGLN